MKRFFRFGPLEKDKGLSRSFISLISYGSVVHNPRLKIESIFKMYWALTLIINNQLENIRPRIMTRYI
jgi:hypothetical protein